MSYGQAPIRCKQCDEPNPQGYNHDLPPLAYCGTCGEVTDHARDTCRWLIQVASGNPEPDFPEDLWREIECGATLRVNEYGSWKCEAGHERVSYDDPARMDYEAEQAYRERYEDER